MAIVVTYQLHVTKNCKPLGTAVVEATDVWQAVARVKADALRDGLGRVDVLSGGPELGRINRVVGDCSARVLSLTH